MSFANRGGCVRSLAFDVSLKTRREREREERAKERKGREREVVGERNCAERLVINFKSRDTPRYSSENFLHGSPSYLFALNAPGGGEEKDAAGEDGRELKRDCNFHRCNGGDDARATSNGK